MEPRGESETLFTPNNHYIQPGKQPYSELSIPQPGWTKFLVLSCLVTTFGLILPVGYNIGDVNSPVEILKTFVNNSIYDHYGSVLNKTQVDLVWSFTVSIFLVGAAVGSLGGAVLADKIGRKGAIFIASILAILAAVLFVVSKPANSFEIIIVARLLAGLSTGLSTGVVPMYLTELAPLHLKGATGVLFQLGVTVGVLLGQIMALHKILGNENHWHYCFSAYIVPLVLCTLVLPILPESPKYLYVIRKQPETALKLLEKIRNVDRSIIHDEIEALRIEDQDNRSNVNDSWTYGKVISDKSLALPLTMVCCLQAGQQLIGINAVFYYSTEIFETAGLDVDARELGTIGAGCCNLFVAMASFVIMSKVGRRICVQTSLISAAVCLIVLGLSIAYMHSNKLVPYISIIGVLGFVICYGIGMGPIPYFIGSELFEVGPRPSAMSLGGMCNWGCNFIIALTFPTMQHYLGSTSFFIFAGIAIGLCVFVRIYLPETKDKDPAEIAHVCRSGFKYQKAQIMNQKYERNENSLL